MFSRFFIDRPIFASVVALVTVLAGAIAIGTLPVAQYPEITPPTILVTAFYPGADAKVVAETVAQPIEQEVNGVEDMLYMSSVCAADGSYQLTVTFAVGTNLDDANVLVQNRVATAISSLPEEVQRLGVTTKKQSSSMIMVLTLISPNGEYDDLYLSNYAKLNMRDELLRIDGVGEVEVFGAEEYSMRVWLNPAKLKGRNLTTSDVVAAIREQNVQVAAGQIGQPPSPEGQDFQLTVNTRGRLATEEEFGDIILRADGTRITRLRDVARIELGAESYGLKSSSTGSPTAAILIYQTPGANALSVSKLVREKFGELRSRFPRGMTYDIPLDTTDFVNRSIREVVTTLAIAVGLVFLTLFIFLQDWRVTLIPALTIPVSLIGTFVFMSGMGLSINLLTLFGLVLAIGIVVDDAIVVVENAARLVHDNGLSPRDAAVRTMREVTGPIIATTLVLMAVFVPTASLGGITGQLYRQFALTIATATVLSSVNALTLSPALSAIFLRPLDHRPNFFFRWFNSFFDGLTRMYSAIASGFMRARVLVLLVFLGLTGVTLWGLGQLPKGFFPQEDQGFAIATLQLPDAASLQRTTDVVKEAEAILRETPGVEKWVAISGFSLLNGGAASNEATAFISFDPWSERTTPELQLDAMVGKLWGSLGQIQDANTFVFVMPAIMGLGNSGGFELKLQDRGNLGLDTLQAMTFELVGAAAAQPVLGPTFSLFRATVPQLYLDVDRTKAKTLGIPLTAVFDTLQTFLGSVYVNDFNRFGRTYQVRVQAEPEFRQSSEDIKKLDVRNVRGEMVPLGTLLSVSDSVGPQLISRYNMYPASTISGDAAPGYSSGDALQVMEKLAASKLPSTMGIEWTGMSYQEKTSGDEGTLLFVLAIVLVYLVLCAQYENWFLPLSVILVVPIALSGTVVALWLRGLDNNIYTQVGIILLVALASKNAILIAEFARDICVREGKPPVQAALEAARLRFRPIIMTALTFLLGVLPLVFATGPGSASRRALGTAVFGGMIAATIFAILLVPIFFVYVSWQYKKHIQPQPQPIEGNHGGATENTE
ncbi:MAG: efflux RND transporter permease subunit [Phycisphaerae bacterium]